MKKEQRQDIQLFASLVLCAIGCGLLIAGFVVPPTGIIHQSILIAFGEILTWVGSVWGLNYYHTVKYDKENKEDKNKTE